MLALTDDAGDMVERYEYGLYGERTVMNATYVVLHESAYNINCGFQGLYHDAETGLVYNRARMLNPRLKRFNQRDPLGYPDGMNTYAAYHVLHGGVDPWGLESESFWARAGDFALNQGFVGPVYRGYKAYNESRQSGKGTRRSLLDATAASTKNPTMNMAIDAYDDYSADRARGEDVAQSMMNAAGKNLPGLDLGWAACEAAQGERKGGADHGQEMSFEEQVQAWGNLATHYAMVGVGAWATRAPSPTHSTPSTAKPTAAKAVDDCPTRGGPYGHLEDHPSVGTGKNFTQAQKRKILDENRAKNDGVLRDDRTGQELVQPKQSQSGVTPPDNEANVDHVYPKAEGGPNSYANAEVRARAGNISKSDKIEE